MNTETNPPQIGADDFARRFSLRAGSLSGYSAPVLARRGSQLPGTWCGVQAATVHQPAAGLAPGGGRPLESRGPRSTAGPHRLLENLLPPNAPDEYAALFEAVYPAEVDRRAYLDAKMAGAKPSYGHLALATLMRAKLTDLAWTTNFDPLLADACAKVYDATGPLTTVALDAPDLAAQCIGEARWPVEVKLHGDFRSRRLKNTGDELRHQAVRLRQVLVDSCRRFGLVVAGYSGRDDSVMDALEEALEHTGAFPTGLFWLHRGEDPPLPRVVRLLARAAEAAVEAGVVVAENFDEALRDLVRLVKGIDTSVLDAFAVERRRWSRRRTQGEAAVGQ